MLARDAVAANVERSQERKLGTMTDQIRHAPLAYENEPFLSSPDGRILRILSEYAEPLARFRREQIQDTVVFFGSARLPSQAAADAGLAALNTPEPQLTREQREAFRQQALTARD